MSLPSSLGEFPGYWDWLWCPGLSPAFPLPFHISVFFHHSSSPAIEFRSSFFFKTDVSAPIGRPFTYSLFRWVSTLGAGSGPRCCGPRGRAGVHMMQKSRFKFLPWPGHMMSYTRECQSKNVKTRYFNRKTMINYVRLIIISFYTGRGKLSGLEGRCGQFHSWRQTTISSHDNYLSESPYWKIPRRMRSKFWQNWIEK